MEELLNKSFLLVSDPDYLKRQHRRFPLGLNFSGAQNRHFIESKDNRGNHIIFTPGPDNLTLGPDFLFTALEDTIQLYGQNLVTNIPHFVIKKISLNFPDNQFPDQSVSHFFYLVIHEAIEKPTQLPLFLQTSYYSYDSNTHIYTLFTSVVKTGSPKSSPYGTLDCYHTRPRHKTGALYTHYILAYPIQFQFFNNFQTSIFSLSPPFGLNAGPAYSGANKGLIEHVYILLTNRGVNFNCKRY